MACRLFVTPVEVSLWVTITTFTSGLALRHFRRTSKSTSEPNGNSRLTKSIPYRSDITPNLLPKTPTVALIALSPGDKVFTTAASIADVPEPVIM